MRRRLFVAVAALFAIAACEGPPAPAARAPMMVPGPPPPAYSELVPPPPAGAGNVAWLPGHWQWTGLSPQPWQWQAGRYVQAPVGQTMWVPGRWVQAPVGGWSWIEGRWSA